MFVALVLVAAVGVTHAGGFVTAWSRLEALDPQLLDPMIAEGGKSLGVVGILSLLGWGLGYAGQPHILARFMAARSVEHIAVARRVAMTWVVIVLAAAVLVGLSGRLVLPTMLVGTDSEKVFITMSTTFLPPAIAGICLAGVMAAIMSTAAAQLLVASSAFAEDFYRGLMRRDAGRAELLWSARFAVLVIAALAFWIARDPTRKVLDLVAWAWAGFGAAFGPAILFSLYAPRTTRTGVLAGILVGGATVILWKPLAGLGGVFALYELVPGFLFSALAIAIVSRATR